MTRTVAGVVTVVALSGAMLAAGQAPDASKVLADMHAAIGGAAKVAAVRTLTAKGVTRRTTPRGTVENETELSIALPDKYVSRTVIAGQGPMAIYQNAGFNGDGLVFVRDAPPNLAAGTRSRLEMRDSIAAASGSKQTPEEAEAARTRQVMIQKKNFARLAAGLLGLSYAGFPVEFSYAGEAESSDGTAHIIDVKGADGFAAQLFVDTKTSRPMMLAWRDPGAGANEGRMIERRLYFADFKAVDGLMLPHLLRRSVDGNPAEETIFSAISVNPTIDPKVFEVSK